MSTDIVQTKAKSFHDLLEKHKSEITAALPKHLTADRMARIALTEVRKNPGLLQCDQASLFGAVIQASQLGLEPGSALGHCYLIPYYNKKLGRKEAQFMLGYRGMLDLIRRSGLCSHVAARAVYEGDQFEYEFGLKEKLTHKPALNNSNSRLTYVYCVAFLNGGGTIFDVMDRDEVDDIRKRAKAADDGPWVTDFEAMAKKTVVRRIFKYVPSSIEMQTAIGLDELAEAGESQGNSQVIGVEATVVGNASGIKEAFGQIADKTISNEDGMFDSSHPSNIPPAQTKDQSVRTAEIQESTQTTPPKEVIPGLSGPGTLPSFQDYNETHLGKGGES